MKIALAFLAALVAVVVSETCVDKTKCEKTNCSDMEYTVECVDIIGVHVCTCMHTQVHGGCTYKTDCNTTAFNTNCPILSQQHCVDGNCRCETPISHGHHNNHGHGNGN